MTPSELRDQLSGKSKVEIRRIIRDYRDAMSSDEVRERSSRVFKRLFSLPEFVNAENVLFYMSYRNEVDTHRIIERSAQIGKRINLPRMIVTDLDLEIYEINNMETDTTPTILGIIEPKLDAEKCKDLSKIDLCLVPGLAFDKYGNRVGWGKGFYDNFLPRLSEHTKKFGLAYDFQLLEKIDPHSSDIPIDGLITESEVLRFNLKRI